MFKETTARRTHQQLFQDDADGNAAAAIIAAENNEIVASRLATMVNLEEEAMDQFGAGGLNSNNNNNNNGRDLPSVPYYGILSSLRIEVPTFSDGDMLDNLSARSLTGERGGRKFANAVKERCGHYQFGHDIVHQVPGGGGAPVAAVNVGNMKMKPVPVPGSRGGAGAAPPLARVEVGKMVEALLGAYDALEKHWRSLRYAKGPNDTTVRGVVGAAEMSNNNNHHKTPTAPSTSAASGAPLPPIPQFHGFFYILQQHPRHKTLSCSFFIEGNALSAFVASDSAKLRGDLSDALMACGMVSEWVDNALFVQHVLDAAPYSDEGRVENPVSVVFDHILNIDLAEQSSSSHLGGGGGAVLSSTSSTSTHLSAGLLNPAVAISGRTTLMSTYAMPHGEWRPLPLREMDPAVVPVDQQQQGKPGEARATTTGSKRKERDDHHKDDPSNSATMCTRYSWTTPTFPSSPIILPNTLQQLLVILSHDFHVKRFNINLGAKLTLVSASGLSVLPESATTALKRKPRGGGMGLGGGGVGVKHLAGAQGGGAGGMSKTAGAAIAQQKQFAQINRTLFVPFLCFSRLSSAEWAVDSKPPATGNADEDDAFEAEFYPSAIYYDASAATANKKTKVKKSTTAADSSAPPVVAPFFELHSDVVRILSFFDDDGDDDPEAAAAALMVRDEDEGIAVAIGGGGIGDGALGGGDY